jgi:hypothetical protein
MKRDIKTNMREAAAILGRRGGPARARALTKGRRQDIASMGGKAKARKGKQ